MTSLLCKISVKRNNFLSDVDVELDTDEKRRRAIKRAEAVEEYNRINSVIQIVDPSPMMVDITIMPLRRYQLYCRKIPANDEEDIKDLTPGHAWNVLAYFTYNKIIKI